MNYFKIAIRNLWRNRLFTTINILGMSVGLACVVLLILLAQKCLSWDTAHDNIDRIYYVQTQSDGKLYNQTVYPLLDQMLRDYPEIETGTHNQSWNYPWIEYKGQSVQGATRFVDSTYFKVFTFPFKYGSPATALNTKRSVVLGEKTAQNLFGNMNPVGELVTVDDTLQYTVTGVLEKIPANSSQQFEVLMPIANVVDKADFKTNADWYNTFANTFILLRKGANSAQLEAKLPQLVKFHYKDDAKKSVLRIAPLRDYIYTENPSFQGLIYGSVLIALFLLFIISVNLINLNTASALPRAKEVAVRLILGASRRSVLKQFWSESGLVLVVALILSLILTLGYLLPTFNQLWGKTRELTIDLATDYFTLSIILSATLGVALIAGTYPALHLTSLKPTDALKGSFSASPKRGKIRQNALIVLQFTLAISLILSTICMREQLKFMKDADLGYDKDNVLVFKTDLAYRDGGAVQSLEKIVFNRLRSDANVVSFTSAQYTPVAYQNNFNLYYPDGNEKQQVNVRHMGGAVNYTETLKIPMLEGRNFSDATPADSANHAVIINESAMKAFGWRTAVGKRIRQLNDPITYTIIGVTNDYHYRDLTDRIEPMLQIYSGREQLSSLLLVRINNPSYAPSLFQELNQIFKQTPARRSLSYTFLSDDITRAYQLFSNSWRMIGFVTIVAILTACAGMFGLVTLIAQQRKKEIGIRKVLGSSVGSLVVLLSSDFLKLVGIAILIGIPVSWLVGNEMLNNFAYHIHLHWWYFALAGLSAVGIALLTVIYHSVKAAMMNPVRSLRDE